MPRIVDNAAIPAGEMRANAIKRAQKSKKEFDKIQKREIAKMRKIDLAKMKTLKGDRSGNTPDLRKNSRQKMRIDKELPIHAYSVEETGKYWHEDVKTTLAVITHARMILASEKERLHYVDDEGRKKGQIS